MKIEKMKCDQCGKEFNDARFLAWMLHQTKYPDSLRHIDLCSVECVKAYVASEQFSKFLQASVARKENENLDQIADGVKIRQLEKNPDARGS